MRAPERGGIVAAVGLLLAAALAGIFLVEGTGEQALRRVVRLTARVSVLLFGLAFAAASLRRLWPHPVSRWLLAQRRYLGLSFALSHFTHLGALLALAGFSVPVFLEKAGLVAVLGGGLAYAFIAAMALTSSDRAVRALGPRRWRRLHTLGGWTVFAIFVQSYLPRALEHPAYAPLALWLVAVAGVRVGGRRRRGSRRAGELSSCGPRRARRDRP